MDIFVKGQDLIEGLPVENLKCFCLLHLWVAYTDGFFQTSIWGMVAGIFCVLSCFLLGILHFLNVHLGHGC